MSKYHFNNIEEKWQKFWAENQTFKAENDSDKPKFYVLDMFPYPSGAGLHVGHPLGYIASDVYARYKRHKGFNVLHPMGYDSFGLPAEQYAIQTGQHPAETTKVNIEGGTDKSGAEIEGYRKQLDRIGFSFDWSREVRTSNPEYYKWTQFIFLKIFESWYDKNKDKARPILELVQIFSSEGNKNINAASEDYITIFSSEEWNNFSEEKKQEILLKYRLTYLAETEVNWCAHLGTVLANDEIVGGVSERGGYPVVRKKMTQWSMRITAYAQRLLDDLNKIDWPQPLKDSQTNWIGRSVGAIVKFKIQNSKFLNSESEILNDENFIEVFTTRPDTIFGVSFMTLAPEHELVAKITTPEQKEEIENYIAITSKRSERERMADVKTVSGAFTGAYAEHPFTKLPIPIWIGDYVLAGYGTGAVMSVPCGDQRDYDFAKQFNLPIPNIFDGVDISEEAYADKDNTKIAESEFLDGLTYKEATKKAIEALENINAGKGKVNFRLRDAVFSRQRYWGEPFPIYYKNGLPYAVPEKCLPLRLPEVEQYLPTEEGEPPLGRADNWAWDVEKLSVVSCKLIDNKTVFALEMNTMPGWAGSSWYFFRYMEPGFSDKISERNDIFASEDAMNYWQDVDLYIGGSEHATGHLLYSRFWVKFLYDLNMVPVKEPFKKLINQGMILGESAFVYKLVALSSKYSDFTHSVNIFVSNSLKNRIVQNQEFENNDILKLIKADLKSKLIEQTIIETIVGFSINPLHVDVSLVNTHNELDVDGFRNSREEYKNAIFISENGGEINSNNEKFIVGREVEKMSKSKYNVVSPDDICHQYGADTLRLYEMFLGPLEQAKPWSTAGISGVHNFLKKLWKLYHSGENERFYISEENASAENLKTLHKTIKKVEEDIENFSFNTSVSTFMISVNELTAQNCTSKEILEPLLILISPYAPHIAEELWSELGYNKSISTAAFPKFEAKYLIESSKEYPISFNGKMRFTLELPLSLSKEEIESAVMANDKTIQYLEGRTPKKVIVVPGKIVNIVG